MAASPGDRSHGVRVVEAAKAEGDAAHVAIYRDLPPGVLTGLAARELAGKLTRIDHVNVTPDLLARLLSEIRPEPRPAESRTAVPRGGTAGTPRSRGGGGTPA